MSNISTSEEDDYTSYAEYKASVWIWKICPPILIILGTIGNVLSIVVLTRKSMRVSTVSIYLTILATVDILVLYTGLLRQWLRVVVDLDVRELSDVSCRVHTWLVYATLDTSVWVLVAVTVERFVSVWFPYKVKTYCTRLTAFISIAAIVVVLLALNSHFLYGLGDLVTTSDGVTSVEKCIGMWDSYTNFQTMVWPWIDLCVFSLVPLCVLIIANISIIFRVVSSRRNARKISPHQNSTTSQIRVRSSKTSSMTVMLLVLNLVFFVCTVPISIYLIGDPYWSAEPTPHQNAVSFLWWAIVNVLMYTNNSINFLMYCISGTRFRETLKGIFKRTNRIGPSRSMTMMRSNDQGGSDAKPFYISGTIGNDGGAPT